MRPELLSYVPDEVHFKDGKLDITGWYFKQPKGKVVKARLLFFPGNAENVSSHFVSLYWLLEHGYEFLLYAYRDFGLGSSAVAQRAESGDTNRILRPKFGWSCDAYDRVEGAKRNADLPCYS